MIEQLQSMLPSSTMAQSHQLFSDPLDLYKTKNSSIRKTIEAQHNEELRKIIRGELSIWLT